MSWTFLFVLTALMGCSAVARPSLPDLSRLTTEELLLLRQVLEAGPDKEEDKRMPMEENKAEQVREEPGRKAPVEEPQVEERGKILSDFLLKRKIAEVPYRFYGGDKQCLGIFRMGVCFPDKDKNGKRIRGRG